MAMPPSGYPAFRGQACGDQWWKPVTVTGHLPNTGFGDQYKHTIEPIEKNPVLVKGIGEERDEQIALSERIRGAIRKLRHDMDSVKIGSPLRIDADDRTSIEWLLDHAEAELEAAEELWDRWEGRGGGRWPLDEGDGWADFSNGVCHAGMAGQWTETGGPRSEPRRCPTNSEIEQRKKDRRTIGQRYFDALAHVSCAQYGYWRLRLYRKAYNAWKDRPSGGLDDITIDPGVSPTPGVQPPGLGLAGAGPPDPCRDFGLDCPPGEGPEDDCPSGFCPPGVDKLPDPGEVPEVDGEGGFDGPLAPQGAPWYRRREWQIVGVGAATLVVTGVVVGVLAR